MTTSYNHRTKADMVFRPHQYLARVTHLSESDYQCCHH